MSPNTLKLLPRRPSDRRRSSSGGSPLRPVLGLGPIVSDAIDDVFEEDAELPGPMPINKGTRDEIERDFGAVDEVEFAFNVVRLVDEVVRGIGVDNSAVIIRYSRAVRARFVSGVMSASALARLCICYSHS